MDEKPGKPRGVNRCQPAAALFETAAQRSARAGDTHYWYPDSFGNIVPAGAATGFGGGKLGIYSYWETCGASGPPTTRPRGDSPVPNVNVQETGNQYFSGTGNAPGEAAAYQTDFFSSAVQDELYQLYEDGGAFTPNPQVSAAIGIAFNNYLDYLACTTQLTGSNGTVDSACSTPSCGAYTDEV